MNTDLATIVRCQDHAAFIRRVVWWEGFVDSFQLMRDRREAVERLAELDALLLVLAKERAAALPPPLPERIAEAVQPDGALNDAVGYELGGYCESSHGIYWKPGELVAGLHGGFTVADLEALAAHMRRHGR